MTTLATTVLSDGQQDHLLADAPYRIGMVALVVHDLDEVSRFYQEVIGLEVLHRDGPVVVLGTSRAALIELRAEPSARRWSPSEAGLFHIAFVLPSRADLGAWLRHVAASRVPIAGASDHIVSEAVYLSDPEGNGIEVYADRPSAGWRRNNGEIAMSTERLDVEGVMSAATGPWAGMPAGGVIGHVHLQSGDLSSAGGFYVGLLGFDIMARYPGALFYGSGGYHHQLATNLWNSRGAAPRTELTTGLAEVEVLVKSIDILTAARARLAQAATPFDEGAAGLVVRDPWATRLRLVVTA